MKKDNYLLLTKIESLENLLSENGSLINFILEEIKQLKQTNNYIDTDDVEKEEVREEGSLENKNVTAESDTFEEELSYVNIPQIDGNLNLPDIAAAAVISIPRIDGWYVCDLCTNVTYKFTSEECYMKHRNKKHKWKTSWV